jgi:hypothetical protein
MFTLFNVIVTQWVAGLLITHHIYQQRRYELRIKSIVAKRNDFDNDIDFAKWLDKQDLNFIDHCNCIMEFLKQKTEEKEIEKLPKEEPPDQRTIRH